ncbi:hypothetical protein TNCV_3235431 [Trichonephila clavipes]|nr:hypothetical protein TNCV_3235431 [Trichonephila clavipes]
MTRSVAKSPRVAEQYTINIHSLTLPTITEADLVVKLFEAIVRDAKQFLKKREDPQPEYGGYDPRLVIQWVRVRIPSKEKSSVEYAEKVQCYYRGNRGQTLNGRNFKTPAGKVLPIAPDVLQLTIRISGGPERSIESFHWALGSGMGD